MGKYCGKKLFTKVFIVIVLFKFFFPVFKVSAADKILLAVSPGYGKKATGKWLELIYSDAFQQLGLDFGYAYYPTKRCGYMANQGTDVDGVPIRVADYNSTFPNLIRVDVVMKEICFSAFATDTSITVGSWESLKNRSYRVSYQNGVKTFEEMLPGLVKPGNLEAVSNAKLGLRMLLSGRCDLYAGLEFHVDNVLQTKEFAGAPIVKAGVFEIIPTHMFLNNKHRELVPKLEAVLNKMKHEGLFEKYQMMADEWKKPSDTDISPSAKYPELPGQVISFDPAPHGFFQKSPSSG